jgi:3-hydroxyethyl bacteriochlorophyllide a dehydrogenase
VDASGDTQILDLCIRHLARRGEVVLAGFYAEPLQFVFPPAFMREAAIRIAAQWTTKDMDIVLDLVSRGALSLDRLITHRCPASEAQTAYETAFNNSSCLKMVLDWRACQ